MVDKVDQTIPMFMLIFVKLWNSKLKNLGNFMVEASLEESNQTGELGISNSFKYPKY